MSGTVGLQVVDFAGSADAVPQVGQQPTWAEGDRPGCGGLGRMSVATRANPFASRSELPFELPPFAEITEDDFAPAFDAGIAEHRAEVDAVIGNPDPATFENTIVALERAGQLLSRVSAVFFNLSSTNSTEQLRAIESEYAPKLTAHSDGIRLDPALYARVRAVFEAERDDPRLTTEEAMLVKRYHLDFVLAGAALDEAGRAEAGRAEPAAVHPVHHLPAEPAAGHRGRGAADRDRRRTGRTQRRRDRDGRRCRHRPGPRRAAMPSP